MPPAIHAELLKVAMSAAEELGVVRVHGQEILRALIRRYLGDPRLQAEVLDAIRDEHARR